LYRYSLALSQAKEINGRNLAAVFKRQKMAKPDKGFSVWDIEWGKQDELYWDEFVNHIWADDPSNTGFWKLVQEQWGKTVQEPTAKMQAAQQAANKIIMEDPGLKPDLPDWAREYVRSLPVNAQEEMLMYAPKEVQERIRDGRPAAYTGPKFGSETEDDFNKSKEFKTEVNVDISTPGGGGGSPDPGM
jgi:hypothetical protein